MAPKNDFDTNTLLNEHSKDISGLGGKVDRCYSADRYEEFQDAVEKIVWRYLKGFIGFTVFLWLASLLGSMLLQKYFSIF